MLPFVTGHDIEVMVLVEILQILGICGKRRVAFVDLLPSVVSIIDAGGVAARTDGGLLAGRQVAAKVEVQVQVFESVDLIVHLYTSDVGG